MFNTIKALFKITIPIHWKQITGLLLLTPILTELLTNNIPASHFFRPGLYLTLIIVVYGPVLLLREVAIRLNLNLTGYILLGLVYGIYNEGLLGKTIFQSQIVNTAFENYGFIGGINVPWAAVIIIFHAFFAFLFPILIIYNISPNTAFNPWLSKKWLSFFLTAYFLYISYTFLKNAYPAKPIHYVELLIIIAIFISTSRLFRGGLTLTDKNKHTWIITLYGIIFVATTFTLAYIIASSRINFIYFIAYAIINLLTAVNLLNRKHGIYTLLKFTLAAQFGFAVSTIIVAFSTKSETAITTGIIFALAFLSALLMIYIRRENIKISA
jgi:hypothetical protein